MSYTDTRADRPLTRRRYPSSTNNNASPSDADNNRALVPVNPASPQQQPPAATGQIHQPQYPAGTSAIAANGTVEMDRYMAYMDLGQLLEHNLEALFPAADELLANHQAATGQHSSSYRNYLMEIEDGGLIGPNATELFAQMAPIDMRSHNRSSRGNSRILRNLLLMDSRPNNETGAYPSSARKSTTYHNNFPDYTNMAQNDNDNFLCNFDTKSSTDPFATSILNPSIADDVHLNPRWQATVPCKYKMDDVFREYMLKEAEEVMDEDQKTFAKELFFAAMFYADEEDGEC